MKLIKCHIENFGKLSDFTYDFTDGCNTVCEGNGWGKSTLAAFLRVMLFGFRNEGKRDPLENERKRYSPWQKGVYGGELQFESEGKQYSVRRTFGSKSAEDEFQLTDTKTNLPCSDFTQNLGEELFRIDAGSFERTIFISQNDCETFVTDGINAKIINIHTIKPLDEELVVASAKECKKVVTVEEHSIIGGLGSAVCDTLCANYPTPVLKIGVNDVYGESGPAVQLVKKYGLDAESIYKKVKAFLA